MSLLTQRDREYILAQLTLAPDSVLADAMLAFDAIRTKLVAVRKLASEVVQNGDPAHVPIARDVPPEEIEPVIRSNVSPGKPSIVKIGNETKAALLLEVASNKQPAAKFAEHLKLLWSRGELKFDGKEYYL